MDSVNTGRITWGESSKFGWRQDGGNWLQISWTVLIPFPRLSYFPITFWYQRENDVCGVIRHIFSAYWLLYKKDSGSIPFPRGGGVESLQIFFWFLLRPQSRSSAVVQKITEKLENLCGREKTQTSTGNISFSFVQIKPRHTIKIMTNKIREQSTIEGAKGGGVFGSRFMRGKTAISHFTSEKLVISRNLMNSFLTM